MAHSLLSRAEALGDDMVALRRDLHRNPELGFQEHRTAGAVARRLRASGLEVREGVAGTGLVVDIDNGAGPTVALRADMDALPIQEEGDHEYASENPGVMHACGHDGHTAGLVGAARLLLDERDRGRLPPGRIRLLFQPCEETVDSEGKSGAMRFVEEGLLDGVDAALGLHLAANAPRGVFLVGPGPVMATAQEVQVTVRGRSAHAAFPHEGIDAVVLAAQGVMGAQTAVSRRIPPTEAGVVTFGQIQGGTAGNVLAEEVRLRGTLRSFQPEVHEALVDAVRGAFQGLEAQGGHVEVIFGTAFPTVRNDPGVAGALESALRDSFGPDRVHPQPALLTGEDFGFISDAVPSAFFWLGAALPDARTHHHPRFDFDESVLPMAAAAMAAGADRLLRSLT
ncbi:MAG: M20 family metallopeptidase [Gemmatimonadota bacterium]